MAVKSATVTARIQPNIKEQAENILEQLGIPVAVFIDMAYRQVIKKHGVPFPLDVHATLPTRDALSEKEFREILMEGLRQAKADESMLVETAFSRLREGI